MTTHLLSQLSLPDRYERLVSKLGSEIANLLLAPSSGNIDALRSLANEVRSRDEGVLVPVYGETGVGKTTFVMNASQWLPVLYGPTCPYEGELTFDGLVKAVKDFVKTLPADNKRIIPINIDHRENAPPNDAELASLKRFLRTNAGDVPSIIFWPETSKDIAETLSKRYVEIAGEASIKLPLEYDGPPREVWQDTARHTLVLANRVNNLEELGIDPSNYSPSEFRTLGGFLRRIRHEFNARIEALRGELEKEVAVIIAFVSESSDPGVLAQLTSPSRYGLLDAHALVSVTSQSEIGKWWGSRRGLLTRTIVQLNAYALCLPPSAAASCIRNFSTSMEVFDTAGYRRYGSARGVRDLRRSDLGKLLSGVELSRFEARGTPGDDALAAFQLLAESGFNLGRDKNLNKIMATGIEATLKDAEVPFERVTSEEKLAFCGLIPDNAVYDQDRVLCVEYTWRKGDFLSTSNRSAVAGYILEKLRNYARQLGWTND
ncbi:hypothetical protein LBW56_16385 [Ralstonia solanacearum]|uniref:hypothetical protein n=1 Tax=Ralstonia solanacearum TaxID=305 RepID=UPI001FF89443|nr:hypothetical protein [Ralstonia solanacearum]MDB0528266.1 hypothetical protein [Ralstonia solanacearum]